MADHPPALDFDVEGLPLDVFELVDSGVEIESLTAGHGMLENGASYGEGNLCCSLCIIIRCGGGGCCCSTNCYAPEELLS